mmetsp:Transcript_6460/g.11776  ORF Transcript_6460/g.11776 Transcript_6460/m.11776 type:complete len:101 (+) Transcript_6460:1050-1352(+)
MIGILPGECRCSVATSASNVHLLKRIHQARDLICHLPSLSLLGLKILDIAELTGMAQLIHDLIRYADISLYTAFERPADFANGIQAYPSLGKSSKPTGMP